MAEAIALMDLMFLLTESQQVPCHIGAVLIFRRPPHRGQHAVQEIVDAYRRLRPKSPFNRIPVIEGRRLPRWREVAEFDSSRHVLHLGLPAPGSDAQLHALIADLHEPLLDRARPGWKIYVIEGLTGDRFAVYHKCHHSLVDGQTGMDILRRSLALSPQDRRIRGTFAATPLQQRMPKPAGLMEQFEREAGRFARSALSVSRGSVEAIARALEGVLGFSPTQPRAFTAPGTPMNAPICSARSITHVVLPIKRMKSVAHAWNATLNDVALAILDEAIQKQLKSMRRGPDHPLVAICPVSLQDRGGQRFANHLTTICVPMGEIRSRVDRRLQQITVNTRAAKQHLQQLDSNTAHAYTVATFALTQALAARPVPFGPRMLLGNAVVSNVRGPDKPLYLNRARLEAIFPVSMLAIAVGLNITLISYHDRVIFGFTANGAALPDLEPLARNTENAFAELDELTQRRGSQRRSAGSH